MDIVIPMSGNGTRFQGQNAQKILNGFDIKGLGNVPKPFIEINGKSMIEIVLDTLNISGRIVLILNSQHIERVEQVRSVLSRIKSRYNDIIYIESDKKLQGPATTTLEAEQYISNKALLVINSDQFFTENFSSEFINHISKGSDADGIIVTYNSRKLNNSFAILDQYGNVRNVVEKPEKYIDNSFATTGVYFWRKGSDFLEGCHQMIKKGKTVAGEYYIAPIYNENIARDSKISIFQSFNVNLVGTPLDLKNYLCK
ncbi:MAG: sugar phosphate nucleotidyltransferase [Candidatus Gracilibacteria bacterium]|nr:sugar phosphate nucleotidyltransferase [Candidatus Gracilibacteria bacterium]